jgi:coenzyme F420 biosynthesis associated uncharacterized protein
MIDWDQSERIAEILANSDGEQPVPVSGQIQEDFDRMAEQSREMVASFTGLPVREPLGPVYVFDRPAWVRANLQGFKLIFEPLSESYQAALEKFSKQRKGQGLQKRLMRGVLTIQIGLVMGYLSRSVLGQFDLGIPDLESGGKLYIVMPNMLKAERKMALNPADFRLWITLHEVTHAVEFQASPWLRTYMKDLMDQYFRTVALRLEDLGTRLKPENLGDASSLQEIVKQGGLVSLVSTPEQREILGRIQAFMSLIEGYSNLVMDSVGEKVLPSYKEMSMAFRRRQETKTGAERLVQRMLGFDLKLRQYQVGELFCREVTEREGPDFLHRVWLRPENLPGSEEIVKPYLWIERVKREGAERILHYDV